MKENTDHLYANEAFVILTIHNGADEQLMKIEGVKGHPNATCSKDGINNRSTMNAPISFSKINFDFESGLRDTCFDL